MTRERRKLAAIVALDVVGYSRLMERDEGGTLATLTEHRTERLEPTLARHGGRLIKLIGDGALVEFGSVVDALLMVGMRVRLRKHLGFCGRRSSWTLTSRWRVRSSLF